MFSKYVKIKITGEETIMGWGWGRGMGGAESQKGWM